MKVWISTISRTILVTLILTLLMQIWIRTVSRTIMSSHPWKKSKHFRGLRFHVVLSFSFLGPGFPPCRRIMFPLILILVEIWNCDGLEENNFDPHYGPASSYLNLIRNCLQDANINLNFHPALLFERHWKTIFFTRNLSLRLLMSIQNGTVSRTII